MAHLLEQEVATRQQRRIERLRLGQAAAGKTFAVFDEGRLPLRIRRRLPFLQAGDFVNQAQNVLCFGLPGTGKTHLAAISEHLLVVKTAVSVAVYADLQAGVGRLLPG
ncbi:MAG: ATP-binding protein [Chloroflexi bacterium]|nr:ATP-binding protein [Chloroflexota bacterium]